MRLKEENILGELGSAIGKGLLAGLAGTAAMTLSQMIEMNITKREPSDAPSKAVSKVVDVKPVNEDEKEKVNNEIHWTYGTALGISRGLIGLTGLKGWKATALHFGLVWGASMVMLPKLKVAPPVTEEEPQAVAIDGFHHAVYALATGLAYDALDAGGRHERKLNKLLTQLKDRGVISNIKKRF
ncbi:hypothetical protein [Mucilaginibacter ginkgonis]|uniref:DUF1440 domain-containing protein n=1 Tax=Mucilaginibacter ginkgonis TaxID=2682091 RepID=A0A7T7FDJ7_9SPHI|nr:hypothetical protein [Mucilaginibacter ginkgonis]QQL51381.1 hypothetical protein GO620_008045 [Mucilaginibacter ginkgonis]